MNLFEFKIKKLFPYSRRYTEANEVSSYDRQKNSNISIIRRYIHGAMLKLVE